MIIPKANVEKFLARKRDDYRSWKKITNKQIDALAAELPSKPPSALWRKMRKVQRIMFVIGAMAPGHKFAFHADTGTGKSLLSIALTRYVTRRRRVYRTLVLVPRNVNKAEWRRELRKHVPDASYVLLTGSSERKWQLLEEADDEFVVTTYAGLVRMICKVTEPKPGQRKKKNFLKPNMSRMKRLLKSIDGLIADESTELSSKSSLAWRICRKISQSSGMTILLSGTPFGRDPLPVWSQIYLVDEGWSLGENLGMFRAAYYRVKDNYWSGFPDYVFDKKKADLLHHHLAHRSIRIEANEADLPKATRITKEVSIGNDVKAYYDEAKKMLIAAHGNVREMQNAFIRMRQISSGYIGFEDDETGEKAKFEFPTNPKLDMCLGLVESVYQQHKSIVVHDYVHSGRMITRELKKLKIPHVWIYGGTKDPEAALDEFVDPSSDVTTLVANATMLPGLNLQIGKYMFFFESPTSPLIRKQDERRIERQFSDHDVVFLYDLVVRGTFDERILRSHQQGYDIQRAVLSGKERP